MYKFAHLACFFVCLALGCWRVNICRYYTVQAHEAACYSKGYVTFELYCLTISGISTGDVLYHWQTLYGLMPWNDSDLSCHQQTKSSTGIRFSTNEVPLEHGSKERGIRYKSGSELVV
ncbi:hypothetical protein B0J15DRAFT_282625 [Fusarium solani]|uniref:Uncharacterized protein n=1 Tax=Fusarium solani TaxID=169388 RepID=A0A9P9HPM4_FUSSL|nr:uncharacterized protein B0J15DRAFT_282625 [Fusarium solani]KAH7260259.1 hypothetical protein B0J15DRAFT_282625 [Fusarium solani]